MKKIIGLAILVAFFAFAYFTKPDDRSCKIMVVKAVWGNLMPNEHQSPRFFSQFMDLYNKDITIDDWVLFKIIKYKLPDRKQLTSIGVFKRIYFVRQDK
ncbi:MAG: hypothetical protein ABI297_08115 [Ginsengibacter sp.]